MTDDVSESRSDGIGTGAPVVDRPRLTMEMVRAGVRAFRKWNEANEEPECMVAEVFLSMLDEAKTAQQAYY